MAVLSEKNLEKRYQDKSVSFSSHDYLGNCRYMFVVAGKYFYSEGYWLDAYICRICSFFPGIYRRHHVSLESRQKIRIFANAENAWADVHTEEKN